ncbi:MAG: cadherin-like domain-containing protein [Mycobacterium sp.]|nr:cadherin-like domain-containing protein [Mycobacterium sp.]
MPRGSAPGDGWIRDIGAAPAAAVTTAGGVSEVIAPVRATAGSASTAAGPPPFGEVIRYTLFGKQPTASPVQTTGQSADGVVTGDLQAGPIDALLSYELTDQPAHGTVVIDSGGGYTYAPDPEFARAGGTDQFSVTIDAGSAYRLSGPAGVVQTLLHTLAQLIGLSGPDSLVVMVTASVAGINRRPTAVADAFTTSEGVPVTGNLLANDTDPDADPLTASLEANATHGTVTLDRDGGFTYTPEQNFSGTDGFTYTVSDGIAVSSATLVTIAVAQAPDPDPQPEPDPAGANLLQNPTFADGLSSWSASGAVSVADDGVALSATATDDARITQRITGLKPQTLYTLSVTMSTTGTEPSDVWGVWGVVDGPQLDKTGSAQSASPTEQRLTVYTGADSTAVTVFVAAGRNSPAGVVHVTDIVFVEGSLDPPAVDPTTPGASPPPLVTLPGIGENLVANGDFDADAGSWVLDQAVRQSDGTIRIASTPDQTGRIAQDLPMLLAPGREYVLTARARVDAGDATLTVSSPDGSLTAWQLITDTTWQPVEIAFTTTDSWTPVKVVAENWKGDGNALYVDDITIRANGDEWLDTPNPYPSPQPELFDDFDNGIDPQRWLIADKAWGGDNGGVVPANVAVADGVVHLSAHGDDYTGDVLGHGGRTTRVGAVIVTRDYYASGRYEVRARVPQVLGAATAFWSFHYIEYSPTQPEYWTEANRIRNSEIDWEFPTARDDGSPNDPVTFDHARANTWGGEFGGEGGNVSLRPDIGELVADGEFHTYAYDWWAGGDGVAPYVAWSIDGVEVARYTGEPFGQDNVPHRASRFWIGIWFPASGYRDQVGWAGNPDFDTTSLDIDWVRITPTYAPADTYEPETWPNGFYASPDQYPG